jgi:hypothetical protein
MSVIEHWFCPGCGEIDGPRAGMTCHGPGNTGGCASVGNKVVEISHDAAKRLTGAVSALCDLVERHELIANTDDSTRALFLSAARRARGQ